MSEFAPGLLGACVFEARAKSCQLLANPCCNSDVTAQEHTQAWWGGRVAFLDVFMLGTDSAPRKPDCSRGNFWVELL
jgi:hypothetical protein